MQPIQHDYEQGSNEWLEFRKSKIGASEAPIIMGVSPWKKPTELWQQKLGLIDEPPINYAMQRGRRLEPQARAECCRVIDEVIEPAVLQHPELPWMIASMDGYNREKGIAVEIKVGNIKDHNAALDGVVPKKYYPQLQHQLAVCGLDEMIYYSHHNESVAVVKVQRDQEYIDRLIEKEKQFLQCLQDGIPPVDVSNIDDFLVTQALCEELVNILDEKASLKSREEEIKDILKRQNREQECAGIKIYQKMVPGKICYENIPQLRGIDLEDYREAPTYTWAISQMKKNNLKKSI